jgi:threonine dehydratase
VTPAVTTLVSIDDIRAAAARIAGVVRRTPLIDVGGVAGQPAFAIKCENMQPAGAFKIRGAYNMMAQLPPEARAAGVITYSSGNHGQAMALAAQLLGIRAVVVMPETAPRVKVAGAERLGAEVLFAGTTVLDRKARAEAEAAARGLTMVPPFDHPWIIAGQGTCGLEVVEQCAGLRAVYVPMGGGGLVSGVAVAVKTHRPEARVIGVEPEGAPKMTASRAAGHPVTLSKTSSIADGLLSIRPGDLTFAHVQALVDDLITVTENEIEDAIKWLFDNANVVAEPSGAVTVAAVLRDGTAPAGTVAIISGGNVAPEDYARYITRSAASPLRFPHRLM